ncbi:unnamed protein product, partial [marine sediment metagenome]
MNSNIKLIFEKGIDSTQRNFLPKLDIKSIDID